MAEQKISFMIGSVFTGEGFKKAESTVKSMNAEMKRGVEVSSQIAGAFGGMDTSATRSMAAVSEMISSIMSLNAVSIVSQAAMLALNFVIDDMKKKAEEATEKANGLKAAVDKMFPQVLSERMSEIKKQTSEISYEFESITKEANAFSAAMNSVVASQNSGGILHLQVEKLNAMLEAHTEAQRQDVEAAYNLKIAIEKSANSEMEWNLKIDAAKQAIVDNENRIANFDKQLAVVSAERVDLEQTLLNNRDLEATKQRELQAKVNELKEQEAALERKKIEAESNMDVLRLSEKKVTQDAINAKEAATLEIRNAELAELKLTEARKALTAKKEEHVKAEGEAVEAVKQEKSDLEKAAELTKQLNDSRRSLLQAESDYRAKLAEYNSGDIISNAIRNMVGGDKGIGASGLLPVDIQKGIALTTADQKVNDAIRNGSIVTVKDAAKMERIAMREARDAIAKNQAQQIKEAQRYKRLQEMNPKALCSADRDFMAKYEKIQKSADERKKALDEAKKVADEQKKKVIESAKSLDEIKTRLIALGLK